MKFGRAGVALVLGLLTTWGVSAACATFGSYTTMLSGAAGTAAPTWTFRQWRSLGMVSNNYGPCFEDRKILGYEGAKPQLISWWSRMRGTPVKADYEEESLNYVWFNETATGWPLASFVSETKYDGRTSAPGYVVERHGSFEFERSGGRIVLPYQPLWRGCIACTLMYGAGWMLVLCGPGAWKRARRRRKGMCVRCGYDLRGSTGVCPECGKDATSLA